MQLPPAYLQTLRPPVGLTTGQLLIEPAKPATHALLRTATRAAIIADALAKVLKVPRRQRLVPQRLLSLEVSLPRPPAATTTSKAPSLDGGPAGLLMQGLRRPPTLGLPTKPRLLRLPRHEFLLGPSLVAHTDPGTTKLRPTPELPVPELLSCTKEANTSAIWSQELPITRLVRSPVAAHPLHTLLPTVHHPTTATRTTLQHSVTGPALTPPHPQRSIKDAPSTERKRKDVAQTPKTARPPRQK